MKIATYRAIAALILPTLVCQAAETGLAGESGVTLEAATLLPAEDLQGPSHRVRPLVFTDGYLAHFTIDSDFGSHEVAGTAQARRIIREIQATRQLVETSRGDLFAEGMRRSIEQPIDAVKNLATHPVETLKQAPATVGHFFSKVGSSVSRGAARVGERIQQSREGESSTGDAARDAGRGLAETAKNVAGFDKARLDTARQLGVDPYTDNVRLQEEIDKVTWAFFAGGLPLRLGAAVASAGVALTVTQTLGLPDEIYALTSSELQLRQERALEALDLTAAERDAFFRHPAFSVTRRQRLVDCLAVFPKANGREEIIRLALSCEHGGQVDFLLAALDLLCDRQRAGQAEYRDLRVFGRLPGALTASGGVEVPAPVDHVTWTPEVAEFASRPDLAEAGLKSLIHTGAFSAAATAGMNQAGWTLVPVPHP